MRLAQAAKVQGHWQNQARFHHSRNPGVRVLQPLVLELKMTVVSIRLSPRCGQQHPGGFQEARGWWLNPRLGSGGGDEVPERLALSGIVHFGDPCVAGRRLGSGLAQRGQIRPLRQQLTHQSSQCGRSRRTGPVRAPSRCPGDTHPRIGIQSFPRNCLHLNAASQTIGATGARNETSSGLDPSSRSLRLTSALS